MAKCDQCGGTYWTKECIPCRDKNYRYSKEAINAIQNKEKINYLAIIFFLFILLTIAGVILGYMQIEELKNTNEYLNKEVKELKTENKQLLRKDKLTEKLLTDLKKDYKELVHRSRNKESSLSWIKSEPKHKKSTTYTKPIKTYTQTKKVHYNEAPQRKDIEKKSYTSYRAKETKKYQKFSKYIKLVSDSKITILADNKLHSTQQIYGRFYPKKYASRNFSKNQIANIRCGLKNNRYKVVDNCSMQISDAFDKVYLGKMEAKDIKDFDPEEYMIECQYNKEHGVMHNCKTKMYKYKFK